MPFNKLRFLFCLTLLATLLPVLPSQAAQRRRAVAHPTPGNIVIAEEIAGTVVDNVTGQPVVAVLVTAGNRTDLTDAEGKFSMKNVSGFQGMIVVNVTRSGYISKTTTLTTGGKHNLTFRLDPGATVRVRRTNGTVHDLDLDSVEFGFPVLFSGYRSNTFDEFCKPSGARLQIDRTEFQKINGPATMSARAACCSGSLLKINAVLKSGETTDLYFTDSCDGNSNIDILGREHVSGKYQYISFKDIAEVVFP